MEQNLRFGLVLSWLAVLTTAQANLLLANFEGNLFHVIKGKKNLK